MTDPTSDDDLTARLRKAAWYKRRNGDDVLMKEAADRIDQQAERIGELDEDLDDARSDTAEWEREAHRWEVKVAELEAELAEWKTMGITRYAVRTADIADNAVTTADIRAASPNPDGTVGP